MEKHPNLETAHNEIIQRIDKQLEQVRKERVEYKQRVLKTLDK